MKHVNRRKAIQALLLLSSSSQILVFIPKFFSLNSPTCQRLLGSIVDVIIPNSIQCPGALEAKVHQFIGQVVEDCFEKEAKEKFLQGLMLLKKMGFEHLSKAGKRTILSNLDFSESKETKSTQFFQMLKSLTVTGYFSSEIGATKALRYNPIPGKYVGCVPYKQGELAWY